MRRLVKWMLGAAAWPWTGWQRDGGALVLTFHRVRADGEEAPGTMGNLSVEARDFRGLLEWLCEVAEPIGLEEWWAGGGELRAPKGKRGYFCVTFDDGWGDNARVAYPILRELGVPATVFLATGAVDGRVPFWWQVAGADDVEIERLKREEPEGLARRFAEAGGAKERKRAAGEFLTWEQVEGMAKGGGVRFGLHGHRHELMDSMRRADALEDVQRCSRLVRGHVPSEAVSPFFCWPNGNVRDDLSVEMSGLGLEGGVSTRRGIADARDLDGRWKLPRVNVDGRAAADRRLWKWLVVRGQGRGGRGSD